MNYHDKLIKKNIKKIIPFMPTKYQKAEKSNKILILFSDFIYKDDKTKLKVFIKIISNDRVYILIDKKITCNKENIINTIKNISTDIDNIIVWLNKIQNPSNSSSNIVTYNNINILYTVDDDEELNYAFTKIPVDTRKAAIFNIKEMKLIIKELKLFRDKLSK